MALSKDIDRPLYQGEIHQYDVAATTTIYKGGLVSWNNSDGCRPFAVANTSDRILGIAQDSVDNAAGAAGDEVCDVLVGGEYYFANDGTDPLSAASIGDFAYAYDDTTVRAYNASKANIPVGIVLGYSSTLGVLVGEVGLHSSPDLVAGTGVTFAAAATVKTTTGDLTLQSTDDDVIVKLGDAAGAKKLKVQDSAAAEVFAVDSNGEVEIVAGQGILGAGALGIAVAPGAFDISVTMGDAAGAQKVSFLDSASVEVARITSDGDIQCDGDATIGGTLAVTGAQTFTGATYADGGLDRSAAAALSIGVTNATSLEIAKAGVATTVNGSLVVDQTLTQTGVATFAAQDVHNAGISIAAGQAITGAGALSIGVAAGAFDISVPLGDAAGAQKISFLNSAAAEMARIDSRGNVQCDGTLDVGSTSTLTGAVTASAGVVIGAGQAVTGAGGLTIGPPTAAVLDITAAAGQNIEINLGDNGAANKLSILDSLGVEVARIDSDGAAQFDGTIQIISADAATAGVPLQAEMVAAFGVAGDGRIGVLNDTDGAGVAYLCFSGDGAGAGTGWFHIAGTLGM